MSTQVKQESFEQFQTSNKDKRSRDRDRVVPASSSEWAEVLATTDRYY